MATIIAAGGSLTTTVDTAIESTAQLRYLRVSVYNTGSSMRTVSVKFGAQLVETITLLPGESRVVGPHALGSAETLKAWQDSGTDVTYRVTGEY